MRFSIAVNNLGFVWLLLAAFCSPCLSAQGISGPIPQTIAAVTNIDHTNPQAPGAVFEVFGTKKITAAVIVNSEPPPNYGDFTTLNFPGNDLGQGGSMRAPAWANSTLQNTFLAAVIFSDGTSMGSHLDVTTGNNVIQELFEERMGSAEEWSYWQGIIAAGGPDPHAGIQSFIAAVKKATGSLSGSPSEQKGRFLVLQAVRNAAKRLEGETIPDEPGTYSKLQTWAKSRSDLFAASARSAK